MEVFLSHASSDNVSVAALEQQLLSLSVKVYVAEHDQAAGTLLSDKVKAAVRRSEIIVVLLTRAGYDSRYVHQEIGLAQGQGKLVVPLLDAKLSGVDLGLLNGIEYIQFDPDQPQGALDSLAERVGALARKQANQDLATAAFAVLGRRTSRSRRPAQNSTLRPWSACARGVLDSPVVLRCGAA